MSTIFGIPTSLLSAQLLLGLINGAFYALLSLGLAVIFGMLGIVNFAHGALYMLGAFVAWMMLEYAGINYWLALLLSPLLVGLYGLLLERTLIRRLYTIDHVYGLLLTYGIALFMQGLFRNLYGSSGLPYTIPEQLQGAINLGFMFLPIYRAWVVVVALVVCGAIWYLIDRTSIGANPTKTQQEISGLRKTSLPNSHPNKIQSSGSTIDPCYEIDIRPADVEVSASEVQSSGLATIDGG